MKNRGKIIIVIGIILALIMALVMNAVDSGKITPPNKAPPSPTATPPSK